MTDRPNGGWPQQPVWHGAPPPVPPPGRTNTAAKVAVAVLVVVLVGLLTTLVLVLANRGNDNGGGDSGSDREPGSAAVPGAPESDWRDQTGTARPTAPSAPPPRPAEDYEDPALAFVGAAQNGDERAAATVSCAAFRGKFPIKPLGLHGPDGTTITGITRYEKAGSDVAGDRSDARVGIRVFGPTSTGSEGELMWVFDVELENGRYAVCGTRIKAGNDMNFN